MNIQTDPDDSGSFIAQSGVYFIRVLLDMARRPEASASIRADAKIIMEWIGYSSGDLTLDQCEKISRGWKAYIAIGLAPSEKLQSAFTQFRATLPIVTTQDRPTEQVMDAFDRMLATDNEIKVKRAADAKAVEERFRALSQTLAARETPDASWWRQQTPLVRRWVFVAVVWAAFTFIYALFFDPFEVGGWLSMGGDEMNKLALIMLAPVAGGAVSYSYQRWVR